MQERTSKNTICCVKDSTVADLEFASVDFKSDDLVKERGKMDCRMSGCDARDIPEVVRKAMDVKDPVGDIEGHTSVVVDFKKGDIPEVVRKAMDVKDPVHDVEGHTQGVVDLEEGMKMVQDMSDGDLRDILEVVREAMDLKVPVSIMDDLTPGEDNFQEERKMVKDTSGGNPRYTRKTQGRR